MTSILCDLVSDLHVDELPLPDWTDVGTSPFCIVAGDVARDRTKVQSTLEHLSRCYQQVFYIDGNEEHRPYLDDIDTSYSKLSGMVAKLDNVIFLRNDVVVINGVALIAANGWWNFDFESGNNIDATLDWYCKYVGITRQQALRIVDQAESDTMYLINSVRKVQIHPDVHSIVMITHTLPNHWLISHDIDLAGTERVNCVGNQKMAQVFGVDLQRKIKMWCVGHYHMSLDQELDGIRYLSNVRGRFGTEWFNHAYYPKRLCITN